MLTFPESPTVFDQLGIVVGIEAEARIASRLAPLVEVGGGGAEGAAAATSRLIAKGARTLLSFGLAGGLDPTFAPGDLLVPDVILSTDGHWPTDPRLGAILGRVGGALFSGGVVVATAAAKRALYARTGAAAVDLESAAVAEQAARRAIPFAAFRAICDPAARSLPRAALVALDPEGRIGVGRVLREVLAHPGELPSLLALATDAARARRALATRVSAIRRDAALA